MPVVLALYLARTDAGDDGCLACPEQRLHYPLLRVVALVDNDCLRINVLEQNIRSVQIRGLSAREVKTAR